MILNVADYDVSPGVEGPGTRFAIWTQGCSIRCKGCWNSHLWSFEGGTPYSISDLMDLILKAKKEDDIEGITLVGGEPLDQIEAIITLIKAVKSHGLSVVLYTGYTLEQIHQDPKKHQAFQESDIVIYGPFIEEQKNLYLKWRGSENQAIHINNPKYKYLEAIDDNENEFEIHVYDNGEIKVFGYVNEDIIQQFINQDHPPTPQNNNPH